MTATLANLRELTRSPSAFAAFQFHFVSTFAAIISLSRKIIYLRGTNTSESCSAFTVTIPPPGKEPEAFNSLVFFWQRPYLLYLYQGLSPLMRQRCLNRGFHKTMSGDFPQVIIRLNPRTASRLHF